MFCGNSKRLYLRWPTGPPAYRLRVPQHFVMPQIFPTQYLQFASHPLSRVNRKKCLPQKCGVDVWQKNTSCVKGVGSQSSHGRHITWSTQPVVTSRNSPRFLGTRNSVAAGSSGLKQTTLVCSPLFLFFFFTHTSNRISLKHAEDDQIDTCAAHTKLGSALTTSEPQVAPLSLSVLPATGRKA